MATTLLAPLYRSLLPRYAAGTLPAFLARRVEGALAEDAALAAAYDALRRAERAAGRTVLTTAQRDRLEARILDALDAAGDADTGAHGHAHAHAPRLLPALSTALAACAVIAFVVVKAPAGGFSVGDLEARGAHTSPGSSHGSSPSIAADPVGVKVSCLSRDNALIASAVAGARKASDVLHCPSASLLAFSTTNLSKEERHLLVMGVAPDGSRRFYEPFTGAAVPVAPGAVDDVLPKLADTQGMPAGTVTLFVLVSDAAFTADDVERQLNKSDLPLGRLDRLPVDVPVQARISLVP